MRYGIWEQDTHRTDGKERVFLTCHPGNRQLLPRIAADIFRTLDCAIYLELFEGDAFDGASGTGSREFLLSQMDLVVVLADAAFLSGANPARDYDLAYARKNRISLLFILTQPGLVEDFNRICGNYQAMEYLLPDYAARLQRTLHGMFDDRGVLAWNPDRKAYVSKTDVLTETFRAFSGHLFLSYRKKDREAALLLLRLIHSVPDCRDIGIWFDDFLTEGEEFTEEIAARLEGSDAILLAVTPHTFEPGNYVLECEFPLAARAGKKIIPVLLADTDPEMFRRHFPGLPDPLDARKEEDAALLIRLLYLLYAGKEAYSGEKAWALGRAYMDGILVEKDPAVGIGLIEEAVRAGSVPAAARMIQLCMLDPTREPDRANARFYTERLLALLSLELEKPDPDPSARKDYLSYLELYGDFLLDEGDLKAARETYLAVLAGMREPEDPAVLSARSNPGTVHHKLAILSTREGDYEEALRHFREAEHYLGLIEQAVGNPLSMRNHALMQMDAGRMYEALYKAVPQRNAIALAIESYLHAYERFRWIAVNSHRDLELPGTAENAVRRMAREAEGIDPELARQALAALAALG